MSRYEHEPSAYLSEQANYYREVIGAQPWVKEIMEPLRKYDMVSFQHSLRVGMIVRELPIDGKTPLLAADPASYLPAELHEELSIAGLVHDNGKITVAKAVLQKPEQLNDTEYAVAQKHVMAGVHRLAHIGQPRMALWDGGHHAWQINPYPFRGEDQIYVSYRDKLAQRTLALADAVDVILSTDRQYQKARGADHARKELTEDFGFSLAFVNQAIATRERLGK